MNNQSIKQTYRLIRNEVELERFLLKSHMERDNNQGELSIKSFTLAGKTSF